jgi:hypothetical protein
MRTRSLQPSCPSNRPAPANAITPFLLYNTLHHTPTYVMHHYGPHADAPAVAAASLLLQMTKNAEKEESASSVIVSSSEKLKVGGAKPASIRTINASSLRRALCELARFFAVAPTVLSNRPTRAKRPPNTATVSSGPITTAHTPPSQRPGHRLPLTTAAVAPPPMTYQHDHHHYHHQPTHSLTHSLTH